jgi:hypothetical protein
MKILTAKMLCEIARKNPQSHPHSAVREVTLPTRQGMPLTSRHWLVRQSYRMHRQNLAFAAAASR